MPAEEPCFRSIEGTVVRSATRAKVFACGDLGCRHAHLVGYDEDNHPFCEIVIDEGMARAALIITSGAPE